MHPSYFGEASPLMNPPNHLERSSPTWHVQPDMIIATLSHTTGLYSSLLFNSPSHRNIPAQSSHTMVMNTKTTPHPPSHHHLPPASSSSLSLPPSRPYSHPGPRRLVRDPRLSAQGNPLGSALILPSNLLENLISSFSAKPTTLTNKCAGPHLGNADSREQTPHLCVRAARCVATCKTSYRKRCCCARQLGTSLHACALSPYVLVWRNGGLHCIYLA